MLGGGVQSPVAAYLVGLVGRAQPVQNVMKGRWPRPSQTKPASYTKKGSALCLKKGN